MLKWLGKLGAKVVDRETEKLRKEALESRVVLLTNANDKLESRVQSLDILYQHEKKQRKNLEVDAYAFKTENEALKKQVAEMKQEMISKSNVIFYYQQRFKRQLNEKRAKRLNLNQE